MTGVGEISDGGEAEVTELGTCICIMDVHFKEKIDQVNCGLSTRCHHLSFKRHNDIGNSQSTIINIIVI